MLIIVHSANWLQFLTELAI